MRVSSVKQHVTISVSLPKVNKEKLKTGLPKTHETSQSIIMRTSVSVQSTNFILAIKWDQYLNSRRDKPYLFMYCNQRLTTEKHVWYCGNVGMFCSTICLFQNKLRRLNCFPYFYLTLSHTLVQNPSLTCLHTIAKTEKKNLPEICRLILSSFYHLRVRFFPCLLYYYKKLRA